MTPLNPSFRRLVLEYIPELTKENLDDYDSMLALRLQLVHQRSLVPERGSSDYEPPVLRKDIDALIGEATRRANRILSPDPPRIDYRPVFDKLHKLWVARRDLALHQGGFLQIPTTLEGLRHFRKALWNYYRPAFQRDVFWLLFKNRFRNKSSVKRGIAIVVAVLLTLAGLGGLDENRKPVDPKPQPPPPDSTMIQQH